MGFISKLLGTNNSFEAKPADLQTTDYSQPLSAALSGAAPGAYNSTVGGTTSTNQNGLVAALTAAMNGQGPNLAGNQYQQSVNNNIAAGASALGSARGTNPALAAREILQNQSSQNQNAAGGAAQLGLQQQLGATQQLGSVLDTQRSQDIQDAANTSNAAIGGTNAQTGRINGLGQLQAGQNANTIQNVQGTQKLNADVASGNQKVSAGIASGILNGAAGALGAAAAHGGVIKAPHFDTGGSVPNLGVDTSMPTIATPDSIANSSPVTRPVVSPFNLSNDDDKSGGGGGAALGSSIAKLAPLLMALFKDGGPVPGKAAVKGDSYRNDKVPAVLSPQEVVLPRSVTLATDAPDKAKAFVEALQKAKGKGSVGARNPGGYGAVLEAQRNLHERLKSVEALCHGGAAK